MPREGGAGSRLPAHAHKQTTQPRDHSVPHPRKDPRHLAGLAGGHAPPNCSMGKGGWCSNGASDEHQQAQGLLRLARRQLMQIGGLDGSRQGCVRVGAMEEGEQRRRCRGQNVVDVCDLLHEASDTIPHALAVTDSRVVHGAAEAWRVFLPLEHRCEQLACRSRRDFYPFPWKFRRNFGATWRYVTVTLPLCGSHSPGREPTKCYVLSWTCPDRS